MLVGVAPCFSYAQAPQGGDETSRQVPVFGKTGEQPPSPQARSHTAFEIALGVGVLAFGALVMGLEILVMLRQDRYWGLWSVKMVGLTLVITAGLFLIVAGYSQDQVAPMMGILGTVVGYLLGKEDGTGGKSSPSGTTTVP